LRDFRVTVDVAEAMSGMDFLNRMEDQTENWLEDQDTWGLGRETIWSIESFKGKGNKVLAGPY
jgi:hypothetical protein